MLKSIIGIIAIIGLIMAIKRAKKKGANQVYNDKTIKNYKRWHK